MPRETEDLAKLVVDVLSREEDVPFDRLVLVARRDQHAVDAQALGQLAQRLDLADIGLLEHGGVGHHVVAQPLGLADHRDRLVEHALAGADPVVGLAHAVEVHVDRQSLVRRDHAEDLLVQHQRVGAQVDVPPPGDDALDQLLELGIQRRLAAADRNRRRPAVVDRLQAGLQGQPVLELAGVALDGAAQAGQVAGVQRLEHQHERVAPVAAQGVLELVTDHVRHDVCRESHGAATFGVDDAICRSWTLPVARVVLVQSCS